MRCGRVWRSIFSATNREAYSLAPIFPSQLSISDKGHAPKTFLALCLSRNQADYVPRNGLLATLAQGRLLNQPITELKALIEGGNLKPWEFPGMEAIWFGRHLNGQFSPLSPSARTRAQQA